MSRIAVLTPYAPPVVGGISSFVAGLEEALRTRGHEVVVLSGKGKGDNESDSPFALPYVQAEYDWASILDSSVDSISPEYAQYDVRYAFESKELSGSFTAYANVYPALLLRTASLGRYVTFYSGSYRLFFLGGL